MGGVPGTLYAPVNRGEVDLTLPVACGASAPLSPEGYRRHCTPAGGHRAARRY